MIVHHVVEGTGPVVVLLHSTATDGRQWAAQIRDLRAEYTVVAPDLRGYGRSPLTADRFSHAEDVVRLLEHLGVRHFSLVGSSGGGAVALQVASLVPERMSALVLLCAAADGVEPTADIVSFAESEAALLRTGDVAGATELNVAMWLQPDADEATREFLRDMQSGALRAQLAVGDAVDEQDVDVDLAAITCPVTVVSGARDSAWFGLIADHLAADLPRARRVDLPWAGHLPNLERPADITELIRRVIG